MNRSGFNKYIKDKSTLDKVLMKLRYVNLRTKKKNITIDALNEALSEINRIKILPRPVLCDAFQMSGYQRLDKHQNQTGNNKGLQTLAEKEVEYLFG